jgi:hypothetical protein
MAAINHQRAQLLEARQQLQHARGERPGGDVVRALRDGLDLSQIRAGEEHLPRRTRSGRSAEHDAPQEVTARETPLGRIDRVLEHRQRGGIERIGRRRTIDRPELDAPVVLVLDAQHLGVLSDRYSR